MLRRFALLDQTRQNGVFFINFRRTHYHFVFGITSFEDAPNY